MALAERTAGIVWNGTLASGSGQMRAGSGAVQDLPVDWAQRDSSADGTTSPEELLAAAYASCYAMSLALLLTREGHEPGDIDVQARCTLEEDGDWYRIARIDAEVTASVDGMDDDGFQRVAREADERCPVAVALRGDVEVNVTASLK